MICYCFDYNLVVDWFEVWLFCAWLSDFYRLGCWLVYFAGFGVRFEFWVGLVLFLVFC